MTVSATAPTFDAESILAKVRALDPQIREQADAIEEARRLPDALYDALTATGAIRMAMPRAWGGPELDPLAQIEVIEALSRADASVGWCTSILSDCGFYGGYLSDTAGREIFGDLDSGAAGMLMPVGRAETADGGYRTSGHWSFGSGIHHARWITGGCLVMKDGQPIIEETGLPRWRIVIVPPEEVEILDTWHVTGLAGSGSNDYRCADVFVKAEHTFNILEPTERTEPLYQYHGLFFANVPGIPLGLARRAMDEAYALAESKLVPPAFQPVGHEQRVQTALAEAEGHLCAARSYCFDVMGTLWDGLCRGDKPTLEERARMALMLTHVAQACRRSVELTCEVAGSTALYRKSPLERVRRDMIAVCSHIVHQHRTLEPIGKVLLGIAPGPTIF